MLYSIAKTIDLAVAEEAVLAMLCELILQEKPCYGCFEMTKLSVENYNLAELFLFL